MAYRYKNKSGDGAVINILGVDIADGAATDPIGSASAVASAKDESVRGFIFANKVGVLDSNGGCHTEAKAREFLNDVIEGKILISDPAP